MRSPEISGETAKSDWTVFELAVPYTMCTVYGVAVFSCVRRAGVYENSPGSGLCLMEKVTGKQACAGAV